MTDPKGKQTLEEANDILDAFIDEAPPNNLAGFGPVPKEAIKTVSPQSKLILLLQQVREERRVELIQMVPAAVDHKFFEWLDVNIQQATARNDKDAVRTMQTIARLARAVAASESSPGDSAP